MSVGAVSWGCPAPKQHHPKRRLTRKMETRVYAPAQGKAQHSPLRHEGKTEQTPTNGDRETSPGTPSDLPPEPEPGPPPRAGRSGQREAERGKKLSPESMLNRSGEEGGKLRWLPAGLSSSAQPGEQFS